MSISSVASGTDGSYSLQPADVLGELDLEALSQEGLDQEIQQVQSLLSSLAELQLQKADVRTTPTNMLQLVGRFAQTSQLARRPLIRGLISLTQRVMETMGDQKKALLLLEKEKLALDTIQSTGVITMLYEKQQEILCKQIAEIVEARERLQQEKKVNLISATAQQYGIATDQVQVSEEGEVIIIW